MPNQTDIQQLIQSLAPSGVNNGNPNTAWNQPRPTTPPPMLGADGQWFLNTVNPAATSQGTQLSHTPWQAPANSLQANLPDWRRPLLPQAGPAPTQPTAPPVTGPVEQPGATPVTPPTGTGGHGSPGGRTLSEFGFEAGCVCIDQEIYGFISPEGVEVGDMMPTVNPHTFEMGEHKVTFSETVDKPCVTIFTAAGAGLSCSTTAPLLNNKSIPVLAGDLKVGDVIAYSEAGMFDFTTVEEIHDIGSQKVQHITCGNQYFLAGNGNGKYILHHNMKMVPGSGMDLLALRESIQSMMEGGRVFGGGVEAGGNTRGVMQANGSWYDRPGMEQSGWNGSLTGPEAGGWDGTLADPTYTGQAPSTFGSTTTGSNPYNTSGLPDSQWFNEQNMYNQSLNIPNIAPAPLPNDGAVDGGGFWDKAINTIDDKIFGDMFNQDTNKMNWGNVGFGLLEAATGIPFNSGRMAMGTNNLMTAGTGTSADYARNQLNRSYMAAPPEARTQIVNELSKKYNIPAEQVLSRIGVGP